MPAVAVSAVLGAGMPAVVAAVAVPAEDRNQVEGRRQVQRGMALHMEAAFAVAAVGSRIPQQAVSVSVSEAGEAVEAGEVEVATEVQQDDRENELEQTVGLQLLQLLAEMDEDLGKSVNGEAKERAFILIEARMLSR